MGFTNGEEAVDNANQKTYPQFTHSYRGWLANPIRALNYLKLLNKMKNPQSAQALLLQSLFFIK